MTVDIDAHRFDSVPGSDHLAAHAFAVGSIRYPDSDVVGKLIVVKSALTPTTPPPLVQYRQRDRRFPYHSTAVQWYGTERFDHYRSLAYHHGCEAVDATS